MSKQVYLNNLNKACKQISKIDLDKLDKDKRYLKQAFDIAYSYDLFALFNYEKELQEELKFKLFIKLTKYSGSLSFLAIQILAANSIMKKNNFPKRNLYFGKKSGIAINHLRANKTVVSAKKCAGGYKLNGILTWASGYEIFDTLLIGFHYNNYEYEVMTNFNIKSGFKILNTAKTFIAQSLNTVNIELKDFFVKDEDIVSYNQIGNYTKNKSLSKTIHYTLYALANAATKQIEDKELKRKARKKIKKLKHKIIITNDGAKLDKLRIALFKETQKIITTAMIVYGGKSILNENDLQRYYKELIMFNSNGLNLKIKELFKEEF